MAEPPRYTPLGPSAPPIKEPEPEKGRPPKIKNPPITPQEAFRLPSIEESLKPSKDLSYLLSLVEDISAKVDEIDEKLEAMINNKPAEPEKGQEDHD